MPRIRSSPDLVAHVGQEGAWLSQLPAASLASRSFSLECLAHGLPIWCRRHARAFPADHGITTFAPAEDPFVTAILAAHPEFESQNSRRFPADVPWFVRYDSFPVVGAAGQSIIV